MPSLATHQSISWQSWPIFDNGASDMPVFCSVCFSSLHEWMKWYIHSLPLSLIHLFNALYVFCLLIWIIRWIFTNIEKENNSELSCLILLLFGIEKKKCCLCLKTEAIKLPRTVTVKMNRPLCPPTRGFQSPNPNMQTPACNSCLWSWVQAWLYFNCAPDFLSLPRLTPAQDL